MVRVIIWLFCEVILFGTLPVSLPQVSIVQNSEVVAFRRLQSCIIYKKSIQGGHFVRYVEVVCFSESPLLGFSL